MMRSYLAYQFPNGSLYRAEGKWIKSSLQSLPKRVFFVTDFLKKTVFYFEESNTIQDWSDDKLFFNELNNQDVLTKEGYLKSLNLFQQQFDEFGLKKAIFSRMASQPKGGKSTFTIFNDLIQAYGNNTLVYMVSSPEFGSWLGATPEVLLEQKDHQLHTMSLAGTKKDASIAWTPKELEEQQMVTDYMLSVIESFPYKSLKLSEVETISSGFVQHLRTRFELDLAPEHWLDLLNALHPTPAVGGLPKTEAIQHILASEIHSRQFYSGMLGRMDHEHMQVYVNLRCMQVFTSVFGLYVGGGITRSSVPALEWEETMNKAKTLLAVIIGG